MADCCQPTYHNMPVGQRILFVYTDATSGIECVRCGETAHPNRVDTIWSGHKPDDWGQTYGIASIVEPYKCTCGNFINALWFPCQGSENLFTTKARVEEPMEVPEWPTLKSA